LKIDRAFVSDVCRDRHDTAIVQAIINLGHALDLTVVAEGVETKEQLQYLSALGCDIVQGFLFSKALPAASFEELLMEQLRINSGDEPSTTSPLLPIESPVPAS
jgi:EAL domain-containing protein (putative c-di-GMP-specific phosphodiesterase class I)